MSSKGISTINTVLKWGTAAGSLTKVTPVKTVPELIGDPEMLETTDLECEQQTFTKGVQSADLKQFTANYLKDVYDAIEADAGKELYYQVEFGENGADGIFSWKGEHSVKWNEMGVNAVREMTINVIMHTKVYNGAATTIPSSGSTT